MSSSPASRPRRSTDSSVHSPLRVVSCTSRPSGDATRPLKLSRPSAHQQGPTHQHPGRLCDGGGPDPVAPHGSAALCGPESLSPGQNFPSQLLSRTCGIAPSSAARWTHICGETRQDKPEPQQGLSTSDPAKRRMQIQLGAGECTTRCKPSRSTCCSSSTCTRSAWPRCLVDYAWRLTRASYL